jgi:hypothetical protein
MTTRQTGNVDIIIRLPPGGVFVAADSLKIVVKAKEIYNS